MKLKRNKTLNILKECASEIAELRDKKYEEMESSLLAEIEELKCKLENGEN